MRLRLRLKHPVAPPAPVNLTKPKFVDGLGSIVTAPVVGQPLFIDVGTWTNTPTSFTWQVYDADGAVLGASGTVSASSEQAYIVYDAEITYALQVGVIASNGTSSIENLSIATSAVTDRSIATPVLTRTSSSGTVPMTFTMTLGSGVFAGDELHIQVCSDNTFATSLITQDIFYTLTEADMLTPFTPDLSKCIPTAFSNPTALQFMRIYVTGTTPQGRVIVSTVSNNISPTDVVTPVQFNPADNSAATLSNSNLTAALNGNVAYARSDRGISGKGYAEFVLVSGSGTKGVGVSDSTDTQLTIHWGGDVNSLGATITQDGTTHSSGGTGGTTTFTAGDCIGVHVDKPNGKVYFKKNNVNIVGDPAAGTGGLSISPTGPLLWLVQGYGGTATWTGYFAAASWTYTPASGYGETP